MTVRQIIENYLREIGADGLCDELECGCGGEDLLCCAGTCHHDCSQCVPAKKIDDVDVGEIYVPMEDQE